MMKGNSEYEIEKPDRASVDLRLQRYRLLFVDNRS